MRHDQREFHWRNPFTALTAWQSCKNCAKQGRPCQYTSEASVTNHLAAVPPSATSPQYGMIDFQSSQKGTPGPISPPYMHHKESSRDSISYHDVTPGSSTSGDYKLQPLNPAACLDLSLMHHYTRHTYATLADLETAIPVWQDGFPTEAASHPFLMHGLLALTALHIALEDLPSHKTYVDHALQHYTFALTLYRPELINLTERNCHALFGFSSVAALISFAVSMASQHTGAAVLQDMHDIFNLLKGIHAVVAAARHWIEAGPVADLVRDFIPRETELPFDVQETLRVLTERVETCGEIEERKQGYVGAIEALRILFRNAVYKPDDRTLSLVWPIMTSRSYIEALSERRPMALVILAHYAIFLYDLRRYWWAGDRGRRVIEAVTGTVSSDWADTLFWPTKVISKEQAWFSVEHEPTFKQSPPAETPFHYIM